MGFSWFGMNRSGRQPQVSALAEVDPLTSLVIPQFTLIDQQGRPQTREIFNGHWTILAFTFTNCTTVCPIMHAHLVRLQNEARGAPLRIVTISVDPTHDTPETMRAYAERIGADTERWTFLSGESSTVQRILSSLRFSTEEDPSLPIALPGGERMSNILHPSKLLLIGPDGTVRAMDNGLQWSGAESLFSQIPRSP